ncbi:MAG: topoisomerase [Solibacillus sp.]
MKKAIILGIVFISILLAGCNEEPEVIVIDASKYGENAVNKYSDSETEIDLLSELHNEIIVSITEQTEIEEESIAIMLGGQGKEISISVGFPKNVKVENTLIQKIVEDSVKNVAETANVAIGEVTFKIEKY